MPKTPPKHTKKAVPKAEPPKHVAAKDTCLYAQEHFVLSVTELLCAAMEHEGVSRLELAQKLGWNVSVLSRRLDGITDMTLRQAAQIGYTLGIKLAVPPWDDPHSQATKKEE